MKLIINGNRPADILLGTCECVAGRGPKAACKHLAALCYSLLDYDDQKLYDACTQRLQAWHQPTRRCSNPVPLLNINFGLLQHDLADEKSPPYSKFLKDYTYVPGAQASLQKILRKNNDRLTIAATFLLPRPTPTPFIPLPARVVAQASLNFDPSTDLSVIKFFYDKVHLSSDQIFTLEQATRGQSSSDRWHKERSFRISCMFFNLFRNSKRYSWIFLLYVVLATNVYTVCVQRNRFESLAQSILEGKNQDLLALPAVRHGILNEEICRRRYVLEKNRSRLLDI